METTQMENSSFLDNPRFQGILIFDLVATNPGAQNLIVVIVAVPVPVES
jgi:hypothetical protein